MFDSFTIDPCEFSATSVHLIIVPSIYAPVSVGHLPHCTLKK